VIRGFSKRTGNDHPTLSNGNGGRPRVKEVRKKGLKQRKRDISPLKKISKKKYRQADLDRDKVQRDFCLDWRW